MIDWEEHWSTYPQQFGDTEYIKQVGKTVNGQPISINQIQYILKDIERRLSLKSDDNVLDLCCGNGLITKKIAAQCANVVGIDFSQPLLNIAQKYHNPGNVTYINLSVLNLNRLDVLYQGYFDRVLMYEALQHFSEDSLTDILQNLMVYIKSRNSIIFFGSVPNREHIWRFYNTPERRLDYLVRQSKGAGAIGTWWSEDLIRTTCESFGLTAKFYRQHTDLHTCHYRFDVRISFDN